MASARALPCTQQLEMSSAGCSLCRVTLQQPREGLGELRGVCVSPALRAEAGDVERQVAVIEGLAQHVERMDARPGLRRSGVGSRHEQLLHALLQQRLHECRSGLVLLMLAGLAKRVWAMRAVPGLAMLWWLSPLQGPSICLAAAVPASTAATVVLTEPGMCHPHRHTWHSCRGGIVAHADAN